MPMILDVFYYTNAGDREQNEDSVACRLRDGSGIFVVADGLGGHQLGEVASSCVAETLASEWERETECGDRAEWLRDKIALANTEVMKLQTERRATMKSTVVVLAVDGDRATWANVGDSRLYYLRDGAILSVTDDHSVAYKKYQAGEITRHQIGQDEDQSYLLRTLGGADRNQPDIGGSPEPLMSGDAFLLCSDGVWEYLFDDEVPLDLLKSIDARDWAEHLLLRVISRIGRGNDNLSLMTVIVR